MRSVIGTRFFTSLRYVQNDMWGVRYVQNDMWGVRYVQNDMWGVRYVQNDMWGVRYVQNDMWGVRYVQNDMWSADVWIPAPVFTGTGSSREKRKGEREWRHGGRNGMQLTWCRQV